MYRKTKINVYVVWIFTCRRKRRSRGSNFQHSRAPDFSVKLHSPLFPHFYESDDRPHCAGLPHTQLCGPPRTHERVVTGRSTHTYSSQQFNSWSKLTFHFTRPKARPHICGQLAHTPSVGSRSSRCGNS